MLGYFNRFASDDYGLISLLNEYSVWGAMVAMYRGWSAMWGTYLLLNPLMLLLIAAGNLVWYSVFIIALIAYTFYKLLQVVDRYFGLQLPSSIIFLYSFLLFASFYFLSLDTGESWFWIFCSVEYLAGFIVLCLGTVFVFQNSHNIFSYLLIAICFTHAGGCALPVWSIGLIFFFLFYFLLFKKNKYVLKNIFHEKYFMPATIAFTFLIVAVTITLLSPGTAQRQTMLPHPTLIKGIEMTCKAFGKAFLFKAPFKIVLFPLFAMPWFYLGYLLKQNTILRIDKNSVKKILVVSFFIFFCLTALAIFPAAYILSDIPGYRVWTQVYFYAAVLCALTGLVIGNTIEISPLKINRLVITTSVVLLVFITTVIITQYKTVCAYSMAIDKRVVYLKELNKQGNAKLIELKKLPNPGMLHSAEITEDTLHYDNQNLKKALGLNFNIKRGR